MQITKRRLLALSGSFWALPGVSIAQELDGALVLSGGVDVTGFNALDAVSLFPNTALFAHVNESLVRLGENGSVDPWLATSWKNVDPVTWDFVLRKGVNFQNGEPFTASAVKLTFDTVLDPSNHAMVRPFYLFIKDVQALDDYTVRLITKQPYAATPISLRMLSFVPPGYVKQNGLEFYRRKPVGTGPFRFVEQMKDDHVTLQSWSGYWGGVQKWNTITYRPIPDASARVASLVTGEIDFAADIPPELRPVITGSKNALIKTTPSSRFYILMFNNKNKDLPTVKLGVRQAISYAIDRESLAKNVFQGAASPAAWMPDGTFGRDPSVAPIVRDVARAKSLLASAGYPDGIDLDFDTPSGRTLDDKELAEAIAGQLSDAGIRATVREQEWGVYLKRMSSAETAPISMLGYSDGTYDPETFNYSMIKSTGIFSQCDYPEFDALLQKISEELNPDRRKALLLEQQELEKQLFPVAYVVQLAATVGVSRKLADWKLPANENLRFYTNKLIGP